MKAQEAKMIQNDRCSDDIVQFACQATSSHHFVEFKGGGLDVLITDEYLQMKGVR